MYAEVIGLVGVLTGLSVTVTLKNVEDISSQDVSIILTEKVQGESPKTVFLVFILFSDSIFFLLNRNWIVLWHVQSTL